MKKQPCSAVHQNPGYPKSILKTVVILLVSLFFISGLGMLFVPQPASGNEKNLYVLAESFTWKEFSGNETLLKESGPRYGIGFSGNVGGNPSQPFAFHYKVEGYFGYIEYDGQTQDGTPVTTDTRYLGLKTELGLGWKIFIGESGFSFEPLAGLGYRWWLRDITDAGSGVGLGYEEMWRSYYGRLGLRGEKSISDQFKMFMEAAAIIPFYNQNMVNLGWFGLGKITVEPGNENSFCAEAGFKFKKLRFSVFYEGLRFSESDKEGLFQFYQPESEADSYGVTIGLAF
ncbi:MAG: hypothetical protein R6X10_11680 [Desulfobacterales bacterium]